MSVASAIAGGQILDQVAASGIEFIVSVPDITTSQGVLWPIVTDKRFRLVRVCKEDEGVSICAALSFCDKRALLLIQYTGLLNSINALRAAGCDYRLPVCMMVGLLEKEPGVPPTQSARFGVRIVEPILDAMGIPHDLFELKADAPRIAPAIAKAYRDSWPLSLLIGRRILAMMRRDLAFRILARHIADAIVVPVYQAAQEWRAIKPDHALTYYSIGAMGQASSAALGLALGRPDKRVIVLDGDGSLLMNLGTLVTIANARPANLVHFVCENGMYEANGQHPIPGEGRISFAGMARAAGYPKTYEFAELGAFEAKIADILREEGPVFANLKLVPGEPPPQDYDFIHGKAARDVFRAALKKG